MEHAKADHGAIVSDKDKLDRGISSVQSEEDESWKCYTGNMFRHVSSCLTSVWVKNNPPVKGMMGENYIL